MQEEAKNNGACIWLRLRRFAWRGARAFVAAQKTRLRLSGAAKFYSFMICEKPI